jgi:hypothetical protein
MTAQTPDRDAAAKMKIRMRVDKVLERVLGLWLPPADWEQLAEIVEAAIAAEAAADLDGLQEAAAGLEMAAPARIIKIGEPVGPPPAPVRERVEALQSSLRGTGGNAGRGQDRPGKDKK